MQQLLTLFTVDLVAHVTDEGFGIHPEFSLAVLTLTGFSVGSINEILGSSPFGVFGFVGLVDSHPGEGGLVEKG
mgnify:CR=1 FL=1